MSESDRAQTTAPGRKTFAALGVIAMMALGSSLAAQAEPTGSFKGIAVAKGSPAIVVPEVALAIPPHPADVVVPAVISGTPPASAESVTPVLAQPVVAAAASSSPAAFQGIGIPVRALDAYRLAASLVNKADLGCNIDWALLAAIGSVESNHGRFGGNQLDSAGVARPGIIGIALNGSNRTARITDSDGGRFDRDNVFDRAVGPMQFIPSTWRIAGTDADGDGVKNPQDMADAATSSAIYLCSGPGDLRQPGDLRAAILRYNASDSYARTVTSIASAYRQGVHGLPASDLQASDLQARGPGASASVVAAGVNAVNAGPLKATSTSTARRVVSRSAAPTTSAPKPVPTPVVGAAAPRPTSSGTVSTTSTPTTSTSATSTSATSTPATSTPATSTPATPAPVVLQAPVSDSGSGSDSSGSGSGSDDSGSGSDSSGSGSGSDDSGIDD